MPFHRMTRYPYPAIEAPERLRRVAEKAEAYNTRVVVRSLPPIELRAVDRRPAEQ